MVPNNILVLGVLRTLGRGTCTDGIEELSNVGAETFRQFLLEYAAWASPKYYGLWVKPPRNETELRASMELYRLQGIPGAFAECDCTHAWWLMCPASLKAMHSGKEGFPTKVWELTANQAGKIFSVSKGQCGCTNDKKTCMFDGFVCDVRDGLYENVEYDLFTIDGVVIKMKGPFFLVDGGEKSIVFIFKASAFF
jgi:hypothetical protein